MFVIYILHETDEIIVTTDIIYNKTNTLIQELATSVKYSSSFDDIIKLSYEYKEKYGYKVILKFD